MNRVSNCCPYSTVGAAFYVKCCRKRLNHVTVLLIHKTLSDELNINSIVNAFASANDTRKDMNSDYRLHLCCCC